MRISYKHTFHLDISVILFTAINPSLFEAVSTIHGSLTNITNVNNVTAVTFIFDEILITYSKLASNAENIRNAPKDM